LFNGVNRGGKTGPARRASLFNPSF